MDITYQAPFLNGIFNILSILLGLAALVFATHSLQVKGCLICATVSGGCCGLALLLQLAELNRLATISDSAAIYDTVHARVLAGAALLILCTALNVLALLRGRKKDSGCESCS